MVVVYIKSLYTDATLHTFVFKANGNWIRINIYSNDSIEDVTVEEVNPRDVLLEVKDSLVPKVEDINILEDQELENNLKRLYEELIKTKIKIEKEIKERAKDILSLLK